MYWHSSTAGIACIQGFPHLLVGHGPVDLVVVTRPQIDHDVLVAEEEHQRARVVQLIPAGMAAGCVSLAVGATSLTVLLRQSLVVKMMVGTIVALVSTMHCTYQYKGCSDPERSATKCNPIETSCILSSDLHGVEVGHLCDVN